MKYDRAIEELRREPAAWLSYDEETRHLLKQAAACETARRDFDPSIAGCPRMMG